jgi:hypothetical protein
MTPEELLKGYLAGMGGLPFALGEALKQNLKPKELDLTQFYQTPEAEKAAVEFFTQGMKPKREEPAAPAPVLPPAPAALPPGSAPLPGGAERDISTSQEQNVFDQKIFDLFDKITSEEYLGRAQQRDLQNYLVQSAISQQAAADRTREKTKREIEKQVLQSWQARENALINRDTQILMGMGRMVGSVYPADALRSGAQILNTGDINIPKVL